jgi:aspartyl protease
VPPVVVVHNGKESTGSWLLDTGAAASMISKAQAKRLGVTYENDKLAGVPEADQFSLTVGGVGGQKKAVGFFIDTLTIPTRERDGIVYKRAPVLVVDITVVDPATQETITLDGVLGMNFFVASANVDMAGGGLMPDIKNLTVGAYQSIVFDEPAATLGLKLKPEFLNAPGAPKRGGSIEIKPKANRRGK